MLWEGAYFKLWPRGQRHYIQYIIFYKKCLLTNEHNIDAWFLKWHLKTALHSNWLVLLGCDTTICIQCFLPYWLHKEYSLFYPLLIPHLEWTKEHMEPWSPQCKSHQITFQLVVHHLNFQTYKLEFHSLVNKTVGNNIRTVIEFSYWSA